MSSTSRYVLKIAVVRWHSSPEQGSISTNDAHNFSLSNKPKELKNNEIFMTFPLDQGDASFWIPVVDPVNS